jgi:hypothetical protein
MYVNEWLSYVCSDEGAYAQNVTTHSRASELRKSHLKSQQKLQVKRALTEGNKWCDYKAKGILNYNFLWPQRGYTVT